MMQLSQKEKDRMVKEVIDNFDFQKVNKVMIALDWKWMGKRPGINKMKAQAKELLYYVLDHDDSFSLGTGGFTAYFYGNELSLVFAVENSSAWIGEDNSRLRVIKAE